MKRIRNLLIFVLVVVVCGVAIHAVHEYDIKKDEENRKLQLISSYELISAQVDYKTQISGSISGAYLLAFGGISGDIESKEKKVYDYWYKREDGGMLPATIDMNSYHHPESVKVVIYENDTASPKVEIWRNNYAVKEGDGELYCTKTEFRFTIPSGSFINTYDFQGITDNSQ